MSKKIYQKNKTTCKECIFFYSIQNTDETGQGLCSYPESYFPTKTDQDCSFLPGELKCKDCARFMEDMACMGCDAEDPVEGCCGFIDILEEQVYEAMAKWTMRGENIDEKIESVRLEFAENFRMPGQRKKNED